MFKRLAFVLIASLSAASAKADWLEASLAYPEEAPRIEVRFLYHANMRPLSSELRRLLSRALELTELRMQSQFEDDFDIIFDHRPEDHNGLTTVIPNERIRVHLMPPDFGSSIGINVDYLLETTIHELSHMLVMQKRSGVFRFLGYLLGTTSRPLGSWPRWLHEGLAVWTEGVVGGRLESGILELDLRRAADFEARTGLASLNTKHLDGAMPLPGDRAQGAVGRESVSPGEVPYHFGAWMWHEWFVAQGERGLKDVLESHAHSLGNSFRKELRPGPDRLSLDELFERLRARIRSSFVTASPEGVVLDRAQNIVGPFANRDLNGETALSWIRRDPSQREVSIETWDSKTKRWPTRVWKEAQSIPLQVVPFDLNTHVVVFLQNPRYLNGSFDPNDAPTRQVALMDKTGELLCRVRLPQRVREVALFGRDLGWISVDESLRFGAFRGKLSSGCVLENKKELFIAVEPLERLADLDLQSDGFVLSMNRRQASHVEESVVLNGQQVRGPLPIGRPQLVMSQSNSGVDSGFSVYGIEYGKSHWGPVLMDSQSRRVLELPTGAGGLVAMLNGAIVLRQLRWEHDEILLIDKPIWRVDRGALKQIRLEDDRNLEQSEKSTKRDSDANASSFFGLVPRFWIPTVAASSGAVAIYAQTFFSDLTERHNGAVVAGFDSFTARPFGRIQFARNNLGWGPFSIGNIGASYAPAVVQIQDSLREVQDRYSLSLNVTGLYALASSGWLVRFDFDATALGASQTSSVDRYRYLIPGSFLRLSSKNFSPTGASMFRLPIVSRSIGLQTRLRYIESGEHVSRLQILEKIGPTGWLLEVQYGQTSVQNFPASYFEWGGLYSINTVSPQFLARGFAPSSAIGREILRLGLETGFSIWSGQRALSWNRAHFKHIDGRLILESVSFSSVFGERYAVGHQYFTSAGGEIDVFGGLLHYINYRASIGVYQGFGVFGETRVGLQLRSVLDL